MQEKRRETRKGWRSSPTHGNKGHIDSRGSMKCNGKAGSGSWKHVIISPPKQVRKNWPRIRKYIPNPTVTNRAITDSTQSARNCIKKSTPLSFEISYSPSPFYSNTEWRKETVAKTEWHGTLNFSRIVTFLHAINISLVLSEVQIPNRFQTMKASKSSSSLSSWLLKTTAGIALHRCPSWLSTQFSSLILHKPEPQPL